MLAMMVRVKRRDADRGDASDSVAVIDQEIGEGDS
jgi:hypothetical protein